MEKLITIIIPTYNVEKYIEKCLLSLIVSEKDMEKVEVLVVNDGTKDQSGEIAHIYADRYPDTIRVIDKENGNYGSCVNRGLKEAHGKYVKVLDADDTFDSTVFTEFITFLGNHDADLIISDYKVVDAGGLEQETYTFPLPTDRLFGLGELPEGTIRWLWHHGITYRTEILKQSGYRQTEGISYTDDEWIFIPMACVKSIAYFPKFLYSYLRGREGQTFDYAILKKQFAQRLTVARRMLDVYESQRGRCTEDAERYLKVKLFDRLRAIYNFYLIKACTEEGDKLLAELDNKVKQQASEVYDLLGDTHNKMGWHYVRDWRNGGFQIRSFRRFVMRTKFLLRCRLNPDYAQNITMPQQLKRNN